MSRKRLLANSPPDAPPRASRWLRACTEIYLAILILIFLPFTINPTNDIKRLISDWAVFVLMTGCVISAVHRKTRLRLPSILGGILAIYFSYTFVAALHSAHTTYSLTQWCASAVYGVLFFTTSQYYRTPGQVRRLMIIICAAVTVASFYGFIQYAGWDPVPWSDRGSAIYQRLSSTFGNPDYAAYTLTLALIMMVGLTWKRGARRYFLLAVPMLIHFIMTRVRAGAVALGAALLLVAAAWLVSKYVKKPAVGAPIAIGSAALACGFAVIALMGAHKALRGSYLPLDSSLLLRYNSYYGASRMTLVHPVLGTGPGTYIIENPRYWTPYERLWFATQNKFNGHVHDDPLEAAVTAGLPAAGLYLAFLIVAVGQSLAMAWARGNHDRRRMGLTLAAIFAAFLVNGLFGFDVHVPVSAALLFVMAGALEGLSTQSAPATSVTKQLALATPVIALVLGIIGAVVGTREFFSQYWMHSGRAFAARADFQQALGCFRTANDCTPWRWKPLREMAQCARRTDRLDDAILWCKQSLRRNPNYLPTLDSLARAYTERAVDEISRKGQNHAGGAVADLDQAKTVSDRMLALCAELPEAHDCAGRMWSVRALAMMHRGKSAAEAATVWRRARHELEAAANLGARNRVQIERMLAEACIALNDIESAQAAFSAAVEAGPPSPEILGAFFTFATKFNRYPAYLAAVEAAVTRATRQIGNPENTARLYVAMADAYEHTNRKREAAGALRHALVLLPNNLSLWSRYAELQNRRLASLKVAQDSIVKAGADSSKIPAPIEALLEAAGNPQKLLQAVTLAAQDCAALESRATPAALDQRFHWLADLLRGQITNIPPLDPNRGKALSQLGALYASFGAAQPAEEVLQQAQESLTGNDKVACMLRRAELLFRSGHPGDALALTAQARSAAPANLQVVLFQAGLFAATGHKDQARALYDILRRLPNLDPSLRKQAEEEYRKLG